MADAALTTIEREFILHFGEMGSRWGINRTVGQVYALLFLAPRPLNAEEICSALGFARSNVSMALKELQAWNLVRLRHVEGDRRDHFTTPDDLWQIVRTLIAERRKREIDPTLTKLRELEMEAAAAADHAADHAPDHAAGRIRALRELIETLTGFHDEMEKLETERLVALLRAGSRLSQFVTATGRIVSLPGRGGKEAGK